MRRSEPDLDRFNTTEVLRVVWETLAAIARQPQSMNSNTWYRLDGQDSLTYKAFDQCD